MKADSNGREAVAERPIASSLEEHTKDELYDRARDLDIHGRSTMTKEELVDAIRAAGAPETDGVSAAKRGAAKAGRVAGTIGKTIAAGVGAAVLVTAAGFAGKALKDRQSGKGRSRRR